MPLPLSVARTRIRVAVAIWAVVTVAWLGSLAMAAVDIGGSCEPDHQSQMQTVTGDWQWLPPGRVCGYAPTGTYVGGPPSVAIEPSWTAPGLIGLGWLILALVALPAWRGSTRPAHDEAGESGGGPGAVDGDLEDEAKTALASTLGAAPDAIAPLAATGAMADSTSQIWVSRTDVFASDPPPAVEA